MTLVEVDPKAPFSIATTQMCRGVCYSIPWIAWLYSWSLPYNTECEVRRHQVPFFDSLVWPDLGLNPSLLDHWRTLYSLSQLPGLKDKSSMKVTMMVKIVGMQGTFLRDTQKTTVEFEIRRGIVEIAENTDKSPWDLRRLSVSQTPVKEH